MLTSLHSESHIQGFISLAARLDRYMEPHASRPDAMLRNHRDIEFGRPPKSSNSYCKKASVQTAGILEFTGKHRQPMETRMKSKEKSQEKRMQSKDV